MRSITSTLLSLLLMLTLLPARAAQAQYNSAYYTFIAVPIQLIPLDIFAPP